MPQWITLHGVGFGAIVPAFTNISSIFGSSDYHAMFTAFAIFGVLIGALGGYLSILSGKQATPHLWAIQFLIGTLIYTGLFVPTDTLNVYDAVTNQNQINLWSPRRIGIWWPGRLIWLSNLWCKNSILRQICRLILPAVR